MTLNELARHHELFRGISPHEIGEVLYRFNAVRKAYGCGEMVINAGLPAKRMYAVLSGRLRVYTQATEKQSVLVREVRAGEVLGLWVAHVGSASSCWPESVVAVEPSVLISLDIAAARQMMEMPGPTVARLAVNASRILSRELFALWRKLMVMDAPTIEARVRVYLSELDNETGRAGSVVVPFNREQMADYFGVTRPAMSRTLGKMRDDGLISWHKNIFKLHFSAP